MQENLAVAPLEAAQVDLGFGQRDPFFTQLGDPLDGHKDPTAADLGHQPLYQGVFPTAQADDDIVELADTLIARREQLTSQQPGQVHIGSVH
jgi:hypothetical protein